MNLFSSDCSVAILPQRMVWYRGKWRKQRVFSRKLAYAVLAVSVLSILLGFGVSAFSPQEHVLVSSKSCPRGGTYYTQISTSLCGTQYDICVSFDYNCGNDYHSPQVEQSVLIYGPEAVLLGLAGFVGMFVGFCLLSRATGLKIRSLK